jgi:hypothetical protein
MKNQPESQNNPNPPGNAPADQVITPEPETLPAHRGSTKHGWHSGDAIRIPTSLTCTYCPLYHVKKRDKRHRLACKEGRKHLICPILTRLQQEWAFGLIGELRDVTGAEPTSSDNARIEQIVRHRSRIFQIENYLKVAGLIDLVKGEVRNVGDRLTTTENALSRALSEFRQAMSERWAANQGQGPRLEDYLKQIQSKPEE